MSVIAVPVLIAFCFDKLRTNGIKAYEARTERPAGRSMASAFFWQANLRIDEDAPEGLNYLRAPVFAAA